MYNIVLRDAPAGGPSCPLMTPCSPCYIGRELGGKSGCNGYMDRYGK